MTMEDSPAYSSSVPPPSYSLEPTANEERLAVAACNSCHVRRDAHFRRVGRHMTLTLHGQEEYAVVPQYENNSRISGTIVLDGGARVQSIVVELDCQVFVDGEPTKIFSDTHTLWSSIPGRPCPKNHGFAFPFSSVYRAGGRTQPLPPSYKVAFLDSFSAQYIYRLKLRVFRKSNPLALWTGPDKLDVIVRYMPRSSPPRPISYGSFLSSSIGAASDEWHQITSNIQTRSGSKIRPITCNMFIPSVQVYGFLDVIPYHVRFTGPLASFWALPGVCSSNNLLPSFTKMKESLGPRVFLSREITVSKLFNIKAKRICDHSESTLRALPPPESSIDDVSPEDDISIDFEGEVRCYGNIDTPGFVTDDIVVQDFIVVSWVPEPLPAPFLPFREAHQIELVTDSWRDRFHP